MVATLARGQLNKKIEISLSPFVSEFGLARRARPSCPEPARSLATPRLNHQSSIWCLLSGFSPSSRYPRRRPSMMSMSIIDIIDRVSPKFIGLRISVPMAFTAKSPSAQGRYSRCRRWSTSSIGSVPSLSTYAFARRWRSPPRVPRHRSGIVHAVDGHHRYHR